MHRRHLFAGMTLLVSTAGCLGDSDRDPAVTQLSTTETDPPLFMFEQPLGVENATNAEATDIIQIGDTDDSHWVVAMANAEEPIETAVSVTGPDDADEPIVETTVELSRSAYVALSLREPGAYSIAFEWTAGRETVSIESSKIDCNDSNDSVLIGADGEIERTSRASS